jgi:5'-nucleotidase / UDP-sugar diphosphatase
VLAGFALALVLGLTPRGGTRADCPDGQGLVVLHFNDFHGQLAPFPDPQTQALVAGVARLAEAVGQVRAEAKGRPVVLLFGGDLLQGTVTSSLCSSAAPT